MHRCSTHTHIHTQLYTDKLIHRHTEIRKCTHSQMHIFCKTNSERLRNLLKVMQLVSRRIRIWILPWLTPKHYAVSAHSQPQTQIHKGEAQGQGQGEGRHLWAREEGRLSKLSA